MAEEVRTDAVLDVNTSAKVERVWKETLLMTGRSCLYGKFKNGIVINGRPITAKAGAYTYIEQVGDMRGFPHNFDYDSTWLSNGLDEELTDTQKCEANYLLIDKEGVAGSPLAKALGYDGPVWGFRYISWSHREHTPDSRGHHIPIEFIFYLPLEEATQLCDDLIAEPQIIEKIFQDRFVGATGENAIQRVRVPALRFMEVPHGLNSTYDAKLYIRKKIYQKFALSSPIGEVSGL